jgi:hypothetical protein
MNLLDRLSGYDAQAMDKILFDLVVLITAASWLWAVVNRYDAAQLAVIGGTVGLGVWGNLRQATQATPPGGP